MPATQHSKMVGFGEVLRYPSTMQPEQERLDDVRNFYFVTQQAGLPAVRLEKGIQWPAAVTAPEGARTPAILIASSEHKVGRTETPWQDIFDVDNGHIRYYGDNRTPGVAAVQAQGNQRLLQVWREHVATSKEDRRLAVPLLFFRRERKGYIEFNGVGLIRSIEHALQVGVDGPFANLAFDFMVLSLAEEGEAFNWRWIAARRD